jgi:hypothetical protein
MIAGMIGRRIFPALEQRVAEVPAVVVLGPRQSVGQDHPRPRPGRSAGGTLSGPGARTGPRQARRTGALPGRPTGPVRDTGRDPPGPGVLSRAAPSCLGTAGNSRESIEGALRCLPPRPEAVELPMPPPPAEEPGNTRMPRPAGEGAAGRSFDAYSEMRIDAGTDTGTAAHLQAVAGAGLKAAERPGRSKASRSGLPRSRRGG